MRICASAEREAIDVYVADAGRPCDVTRELRVGADTYGVRTLVNDLVRCSVDACSRDNETLDAIFECACVVDAERRTLELFPMKHRPDKPTPNDLHIVLSTIRNVVEGISMDEIVRLLGGE